MSQTDSMHSDRFGLPIVLTEHAILRMAERGIDSAMIADIIDTGSIKDAGRSHFWIYKQFAERDDNLLCVAAVIDNVVVVKTVMHHWEPTP